MGQSNVDLMDSGRKYELLYCLLDKIPELTQKAGRRTLLFPNGTGVTVGRAIWSKLMDIKKKIFNM